MSNLSFSSLALKKSIQQNLSSLGYHQMTPIQALSLPLILSGKDVLAQGKTGSGKTAAFSLGILNALQVKQFWVQALVLCPTRELADQVAKEMRKMARAIHNVKILTLCGGMPLGPQIGSLEHGAHIIVGTPGRIEQHLRKETLSLDRVKTLVLDEADRMLDMGFQESIDNIVGHISKKRQTLLFSATYPKAIAKIADNYMSKAELVKAEEMNEQTDISQHFYMIEDDQRSEALSLLLHQYRVESSVVFCNTKREVQEVTATLKDSGISALALHGDLEQKARDQALVRFANRSVSVLVATDVAARGLDIDDLDLVVNYHLARDSEVHVHRVGRTGRGGKEGMAISLLSEKEEFKLSRLSRFLPDNISFESLPDNDVMEKPVAKPRMATLQIDGGKKQKLRPGDILGALTAKADLKSAQVGKINIYDFCAYVAVERCAAKKAMDKLVKDGIKGRNFKVRRIRS